MGFVSYTVLSRNPIMSDMDVFAAMGISGFGKVTKKNKLDVSRFDKNKREEHQVCYPPNCQIHFSISDKLFSL